MANDNKIQLDLEISERSVESTWNAVEERGKKSAKSSSVAFEELFGAQENALKTSIQKLTNESKTYVKKSASESAEVFREAFSKQDQIYKASVKQNIDNAISALTNSNGIKKSAAESASVFQEEFKKSSEGWSLDVIKPQDSFKAVRSLTDIASATYLIKQGLDAVKAAGQQAFAMVADGENALKAERRFESLAAQAGVLATKLNVDLVKAANRFVDDTKLFDVASEAFIRIGNNAAQLPKVLEVARRTYGVFGGDIVSNTQKIIDAAETGSKRTLKDIGLYTDLDAAVKKYARELGTVPALLNETQKQQARLNAILAVADTRLAGVSTKAGAVSSYKQLGNAINGLMGTFNRMASSTFGKTIQSWAEAATRAVVSVDEGLKRSRTAETVSEITNRVELNRTRIAKLREELASYADNAASAAIRNTLNIQIDRLQSQTESYILKLQEAKKAQAGLQGTAGASGADDGGVAEERLRRRQELMTRLNALDNTAIQSQQALLQAQYQQEKSRETLEQLSYTQRLAAFTQFEQDKRELNKYFAENGTADEETRRRANESLEAAHVNTMLQLQREYWQMRNELTGEAVLDIESAGSAMDAVFQGMVESARTHSMSLKGTLKEVGKAFTTTFKQQATSAVFAFAQGSKNAEEAANGLFTGILNAMGEMLIGQGIGFMLQGAAMSWAGMPNGAALVAAGAAMVAFGGTLAAVSAANGGKVGGGASGDAAADKTYRDDPNLQKPAIELAPENPNTVVNVNIDNVFDRKETGMWITEVLSENFEQNGIRVRGGNV